MKKRMMRKLKNMNLLFLEYRDMWDKVYIKDNDFVKGDTLLQLTKVTN
jgi:hypothetical protein